MPDAATTIDSLNDLIAVELVAINQYFVHAKLCDHWGYHGLAVRFRHDSLDEMKDADRLMDRVLLLGGLPNLQRLDAFSVGESPQEQLELSLALEHRATDGLHAAITQSERDGDVGTGTILREMLLGEEAQVEWLEMQLGLVEALGLQLYLAGQVS